MTFSKTTKRILSCEDSNKRTTTRKTEKNAKNVKVKPILKNLLHLEMENVSPNQTPRKNLLCPEHVIITQNNHLRPKKQQKTKKSFHMS
jgi:hypothetical protein